MAIYGCPRLVMVKVWGQSYFCFVQKGHSKKFGYKYYLVWLFKLAISSAKGSRFETHHARLPWGF